MSGSGAELRGLRRRYGGVVALDGVSLVLPPGSRTAVVGPSGSGKSTLLRLVAGFEAPDSGQVLLGGALLADGPRAVPAHRRSIGLVAQEGALFPHLSVAENIGFGLDRGDPGRAARIVALAEMVELAPAMLARRPDQLSGGQQQRVALARALAREPRLMLLDEPFSALDTGLRASTRRAVSELLGRAGITTILVTHDQAEALSFADQVAVLLDGRLLQAGPPHELYLRPADPAVAAFLGEALILPAQVAEGRADCVLGCLPVRDRARRGPATLMLRPEQVTLFPDAPGQEKAPLAEVLAAEFGGADYALTLRLVDGQGGPPLAIRCPGSLAPAAGARVRIGVVGEAHLFG